MSEMTIDILLVLVPALPLAAALVTAALGPRALRERSHWPCVVAIGLSCLASIILVFLVKLESDQASASGEQIGYERTVSLWRWAAIEQAYEQPEGQGAAEGVQVRGFHIDVALRADPLTAIMLATVTLISLVVAVYSVGYMGGDPGYWRFFAYISLFVFSMTMLVSASNFVLLYVFWEAVGFCSYILIGFWYQKPEAAAAGKKAFLVNRVGDFGFALGVFLIWTTYGTLNFHDLPLSGPVQTAGVLGQQRLANPQLFVGGGLGTAICLLLMLGACGKSAQFPLHVWLPDAMEGPSPVSALIHAATMVTAGVYMVARCMPLFIASGDALLVVAVVGGFSALLTAVIALTQTDLKRILAYSTISQLGYMFLGLGAGTLVGVTAGMFHLFTHAFFKALLFLGAGSVMHAMGNVIDIRRFGGLRHRLPTTHWTFLIGAAALAGFPLLAGFWSKDEILAAVHQQGEPLYYLLYWAAVFTALLTALYTFRAFFITFYGEEKIPHEAGDHAHESPNVMTVPLALLAVGAALAGFFLWPFEDFLARAPSLAYVVLYEAHGRHAEGGSHAMVMVVSSAVALAGIGLAAFLYLGGRGPAEKLTRAMDALGVYRLSHGKFFFDEIYEILVVWPLRGIARLSYWVDRYLIDGLVDAVGLLPVVLGATLRWLQGGMIQFYALAMVLGLLMLIGALLL